MRISTLLNLLAIAVIGLLPGAMRVQAHHAFSAEFDANKPVKVTGTITRVEWVNPHTWFHLDVKGPDGKVERWMFEGGGPAALTRRGFTKDFLKPGTELVIEGFMAKGVPRRANARQMTYPDGRKLFVGSSGTGAPADGLDPDDKPEP
jgi:hypothetical protein